MGNRILTNKEITKTVTRLGKDYANLCDAFADAIEQYGEFKFSSITAKDPFKGIMLCQRVDALVINAQIDVTYNYGNMRHFIGHEAWKYVDDKMVLDVIERFTNDHATDEFWRLFAEYFRSGAYNRRRFGAWVFDFHERENRNRKEIKESVACKRYFDCVKLPINVEITEARDGFIVRVMAFGVKAVETELDKLFELDYIDEEQYRTLINFAKEITK